MVLGSRRLRPVWPGPAADQINFGQKRSVFSDPCPASGFHSAIGEMRLGLIIRHRVAVWRKTYPAGELLGISSDYQPDSPIDA